MFNQTPVRLLAGFWIALCSVAFADVPKSPRAGEASASAPDVELVAVCESPLDEHGWWDGDGKPLDDAPRLSAAKPATEKPERLERGQISRLIVLKATLSPLATINLEVDGQWVSLRLPESADGRDWDEIKKEVKKRGKPFPEGHFRSIVYSLGSHVVCERGQRYAQARISVADGPWETISTRPRQPGDGNDIEFDLGRIDDDGVEAFMPETQRKQIRVVAMDEKDAEHHSVFNMVVRGEDKTAVKVRTKFRLAAAEIKAYRLQARPYARFELNDIPLYPNSLSPVEQIRISGGSFRGDRDLLGDRTPSDSPSDLDWSGAIDPQLELIKSCPSLRRVYVAGDALSDDAARILAEAKQLEHIRLAGSQLTHESLVHLGQSAAATIEVTAPGLASVTDGSLASLAKAPNLRELKLWDTRFTDSNLVALAAAEDLRGLKGKGDRLTPEGLSGLSKLRRLEEVELSDAAWDGAALEAIQHLSSLKVLSLSNSDVADAALSKLGKLSRLQILDLSETSVTDAGVQELVALEQLVELDLRGTQCTRQSYESLKDVFPGIRIYLPETPDRTVNVRVRVVDSDGSPVPNSRVWMFTSEYFGSRNNRIGKPESGPRELAQGKTNVKGELSLSFSTRAADDWIRLWTITPGGRPAFETFSVPFRSTRTDKTLKLSEGLFELRIVDPQGQAVEGARVIPNEIPSEVPPSLFDAFGQTTDGEGVVQFRGVAPEKVDQVAIYSQRFGNQSTSFLRGRLRKNLTTIQLMKTSAIEGKLTSRISYEPQSIQGLLYGGSNDDKLAGSDVVTEHSWAELKVDQDGKFRIPALAAGYARFWDRTDSDTFRLHWEPVTLQPNETAYVEPTIVRPVRIEGMVRLLDSWKPAANLDLLIRNGNGWVNWSNEKRLTTDRSGRFVAYVLPGELGVSVTRFYQNKYRSIERWLWRNGRFGGSIVVEDLGQTLYLEPVALARAVSEKGMLIDRDGQPLQQSVYGFPAPLEEEATNCVGVSSNQDGEFEMFYPATHPPIAFRGSDRESSYRVKQRDPLILVDDTKPGSNSTE